MKRLLFLLIAAATSIAIAQNPPSPLQNQFGPVVKWRTVAQGDNSMIMREEARMISGDQDWAKYYREMIGAKPDDRVAVPQVADWRKEDLLILHLGKRPTPGYGVYVETIGRSMSHYYDVHYVRQEPPRGTKIRGDETSPFVIIAIEKTTGIPRYFGRISNQGTFILPAGCGCASRPIIMVGGNGRVIPLGDTGGKCSKCGRSRSGESNNGQNSSGGSGSNGRGG